MDASSIVQLKNLFDQCRGEESSDSENEANTFETRDHCKAKPEIKNTIDNPLIKKVETREHECLKSFEDWNEQQKRDEELLDSRKMPIYEISYKQEVFTEDIYLQMGLKTPATSSCEDMIINIQLPDETVGVDQMSLNLKEFELELVSPVYRLKLPLPHKISPGQSNAKFDCDKKLLKIIMRMDREFDFVNF